MAMASTQTRRERVYSRDEIEALIADGRAIFILNGSVVKADAWRKFHPGGDKAIQHMIGRDATDEVTVLHSSEAKERMQKFVIGRIDAPWVNFVPPIQGGVFRTKGEQDVEIQRSDTQEEDSSSQASSDEPSPLFEPVDRHALRQRRRQDSPLSNLSKSSSATSISSIGLDMPKGEDKESTLDKETRQQREADLRKYPDLDMSTQSDIVAKYRELNKRIYDEGLFECNYTAYAWEIARYTALLASCLLTLHWGWYTISGLFLGCFWHQLVFTAHDAGHMGITHDFHTDTVIGIIIADFLGGLSIGWWKHNHNVHHVVTNSPEHDPDIEHMPFFAISHRFLDSLRSTYYDRIMTYDAFAKFTIRYQHYLYYPVLCFGRFNLYRLSWEFLLLGKGPRAGPAWWHRYLELVGQVFFWTWFGYGILYCSIPSWSGRIAFVMASHCLTMILHVQITLSHFAMSTADLGVHESFPQRMLRTTMDVDCPAWLDWFHGGLQFQAVHHLYPRIPRHNLRRTQGLVQGFCDETRIPYALYGFADGNKEVLGRLGDVARQARLLDQCRRYIAETGDMHSH